MWIKIKIKEHTETAIINTKITNRKRIHRNKPGGKLRPNHCNRRI